MVHEEEAGGAANDAGYPKSYVFGGGGGLERRVGPIICCVLGVKGKGRGRTEGRSAGPLQ